MKKQRNPSDFVEKTAVNTFNTIKKYEWKYRNIIFLAASFVLAYFILTSPQAVSFIKDMGNFGYPASFVAGMFFTYGLTAPLATVTLVTLSQNLNPIFVALIGAVGSVISDYIIFHFVRNRLLKEIKMLSNDVTRLTKPISYLFFWEELRIRLWHSISKSKIWHLMIPVLAGFIIASPLPDEIGVALFGAVKFPIKKFLLVSYTLNFAGILIIGYSVRFFG